MKEANYEKLWHRMRESILDLETRGVQEVHPSIILSFMHYIWQSVEYEEQLLEAQKHEVDKLNIPSHS